MHFFLHGFLCPWQPLSFETQERDDFHAKADQLQVAEDCHLERLSLANKADILLSSTQLGFKDV